MWADLATALADPTVILYGSTSGWAAWLAAQIARDELVVLVAPDEQLARRLEDDVRFWFGLDRSSTMAGSTASGAVGVASGEPAVPTPEELDPITPLPAIDVSPYADLAPDRTSIVERLATLYRLATPALRPRIVVTSAEALMRKTMAPAELASRGTTIRKGDTIDRDAVTALLVAGGWTRTPLVDEAGTFAVRGEVIDIYAPLAKYPVRIELFGDEVETIRTFDPESQRTLRAIDRIELHPVRETINTGTRDTKARIREHADEIAYPSKATRKLVEQLAANEVFVGIEGLTPAFHDEMVAPAEFVPADARWIIVDPDACRRAIADVWTDAEARHGDRASHAGDKERTLTYPPSAHFVDADEALGLASTTDAGGSASTPHARDSASATDARDSASATDARGSARATDARGTARARSRRTISLPSLELVDAPGTRVRVAIDDLRVLKQQLDHARTFGDVEHVAPLVIAINAWKRDGLRVVIACDSPSRLERLQGVLAARHVLDGIELVSGTPIGSFASQRDRIALVTTQDIFGQRTHHARSQRKKAKDALLGSVGDFSQLAAGDYLVHQKHGVGKYLGLEKLAVGTVSILQTSAIGATAPPLTQIDALKLEYDGGTLYLPVYRLGEVQRYVGAEGHAPRLDKLGGVTWEATTSKVKRHIRALAEELLQLYAQRASLPGHRFPPADDSYRELEATFPFDETPDQLAAIEAVLGDMEAPRAMDRLVCGDVGYGKTEVALRAIFRAVQGGKQACVLAPTTVLVEQHYRTMVERFGPFGVNLGKLSRFQTKAEQIATVNKLSEGKLDVVVGTHRALSADVRFKDLGLLVIDEEQRFGVAHKEKIKKTKTQVDVLTLTATPIPRTLHLAMANLRDLSIIATPPADRRAVRTFVSRVEDATIKEAIERELGRGGQVFFITPTIGTMGVGKAPDHRLPNDDRPQRKTTPRDDDRTIQEWADYVQGLVPSARIGIGHGSLTADQLEKVMVQFVSGELDVLVATTIVESGLDIPRANTMFVARADAFGLAQLYQLRGRIGRSKDRAYCYLLVPEPEHITDEARRRLETLQRFTELGAGFQIASQDLEIRGGGELLGAKQSGSIAAVGFDQYVKMLDAAVAEVGGKPIHSEIDPELQIETPGFIPDDYVPDPGQRLELYKKLSAVDSDDELRDVMAEIADRYGPVPGDVVLLGELMGVKAIARKAGVLALEISSTRVAVAVMPDTDLVKQLSWAGWKRLPDHRWSITPPAPGGPAGARRALLDALARAT